MNCLEQNSMTAKETSRKKGGEMKVDVAKYQEEKLLDNLILLHTRFCNGRQRTSAERGYPSVRRGSPTTRRSSRRGQKQYLRMA